ncbi:hypothetical protein HYT92_01650 [Candidatus Pacearchaeota archaeon]|nr:hypothetical protein [Candidatus Pacearchaeota archaeon]
MNKPIIFVLHDDKDLATILDARFSVYQAYDTKVFLLNNPSKLSKLTRLIEEQKPDAILSGSLGDLWKRAYEIAQRNNIPFIIYTSNKNVLKEAQKMNIKCHEETLDSEAIYDYITNKK